MSSKVAMEHNPGALPQHLQGAAASQFTSWYREELKLLSKDEDAALTTSVEQTVLRRREERSALTKSCGQGLSLPKIVSECQGSSPARPRALASFRPKSGDAAKGGTQQSLLPYPGVFIYNEDTKTVKTVKLMEEDLAWLEEAGQLVLLESEASKDEEHLQWQTKVLFENFLRSHCYVVPRRVATPTWLLTRLFQCYCVAASVPVAEVADAVVAQHIGKCCGEKYECGEVGGMPCVVGVAVYSDSPLYTLWASKAVVLEAKKAARVKGAKSSFTRCVLVHPLEAMSGIRLFETDAAANATTGKFVARAVARKLQQKYCCDSRELNKMEFGHVMCKGNRGIKTVRPQCRIMPPNRRAKQEYHYARVAPRAAPLQTRHHLGAAIQQRGFQLPRQQQLHLMRNAQLHAAYYSGNDGDVCH